MINEQDRSQEIVLERAECLPAEMDGYITSDREGDDLRGFGAVRTDRPIEIPARSIMTLHAALN
jgi:hypothetical protein